MSVSACIPSGRRIITRQTARNTHSSNCTCISYQHQPSLSAFPPALYLFTKHFPNLPTNTQHKPTTTIQHISHALHTDYIYPLSIIVSLSKNSSLHNTNTHISLAKTILTTHSNTHKHCNTCLEKKSSSRTLAIECPC